MFALHTHARAAADTLPKFLFMLWYFWHGFYLAYWHGSVHWQWKHFCYLFGGIDRRRLTHFISRCRTSANCYSFSFTCWFRFHRVELIAISATHLNKDRFCHLVFACIWFFVDASRNRNIPYNIVPTTSDTNNLAIYLSCNKQSTAIDVFHMKTENERITADTHTHTQHARAVIRSMWSIYDQKRTSHCDGIELQFFEFDGWEENVPKQNLIAFWCAIIIIYYCLQFLARDHANNLQL